MSDTAAMGATTKLVSCGPGKTAIAGLYSIRAGETATMGGSGSTQTWTYTFGGGLSDASGADLTVICSTP
ncbi:hypothetical protein [Actinoplanes cyaneus]|uniref:hypothetical protein n=1 Tax=Actinoplanes cyaneus TaxID=52696 RepID=UPI001EF397A1|nr:hypothetical protein [Actinoplanes cyaneus]